VTKKRLDARRAFYREESQNIFKMNVNITERLSSYRPHFPSREVDYGGSDSPATENATDVRGVGTDRPPGRPGSLADDLPAEARPAAAHPPHPPHSGPTRGHPPGNRRGQCADDLLIQVAAVWGAVKQLAAKILENHLIDCARTCMREGRTDEEVLERITRALSVVLRQS